MTTFQSIVYGIVHAISLWLPISDQAHLWIVSKVMDWPEPSGVFLGALFLGPCIAAIVFYIHDWLSMGSSLLRVLIYWRRPNSIDERLPFFILLTTVPWLAARFFLGPWLEEIRLEPFYGLGIAVSCIAFTLLWVVAFQWNRQNKSHLSWNWFDSVLAGIAQLLHLIPGAGRQLGFLTLANIRGYKREAVWKYAVLSFTPMLAISSAHYFQIAGPYAFESPDFTWLAFGVALVISFFVSMLVLNALTQGAERAKHHGVTRYRIALGLALALWLTFKP